MKSSCINALSGLFLLVALLFVLAMAGEAQAQTAPVCGSAGTPTPGSLHASLLRDPLYNSDGNFLIISWEGAIPPMEIWIDDALSEITYVSNGGSAQSRNEPETATHVVAFITQGYAPVCIEVAVSPSVAQDAYPVAQQGESVLPSTGFDTIMLLAGLLTSLAGVFLLRRRAQSRGTLY
ncbi:MAG: LPXTG cell wall anchor domain-containing protein [Thermoleophilia bacterium]